MRAVLQLLVLLLSAPSCPASQTRPVPAGPVTLLDFWATTCGPCRPALAAVQSLHARYSGLRALGVAMDGPDTAADVGPLLRGSGVTYPVRVAPAANLRLAQSYGVRVYPTLILRDGRGRVIWSHSGPLDARAESALSRQVAKLLTTPSTMSRHKTPGGGSFRDGGR